MKPSYNIPGLKLEDVTDDVLEKATSAFLLHPLCGHTQEYVGTLGYVGQVRETFRKNILDGSTHCEGFRFGISGWGHTKWRFCVDLWGDKLFRFLINKNCDRADEKRIGKICQKISDDLTKAGFPTVVS